MDLYYIQHVFFETPAEIFNWCKLRNFNTKGFFAYKGDIDLINIEDCDILLIMGGPMGVYDIEQYPWLKKEKILIEKAIRLDKKIIGICLGAQLIADVLGSRVYKNSYKEIGWFPVYSSIHAKKKFSFLPEKFYAFHWHGDTFDLPSGAEHLFYNEATKNQGFSYKNILGLQFHLESTEQSIKDIYKYSYKDIQTADNRMFIKEYNREENQNYIKESHNILYQLLDAFLAIN
ncbi:MAG: amidotransferase [Leptospiraceae bacterium]|nr:MAG: amidotransferase [Leptospiraceae bacterium]